MSDLISLVRDNFVGAWNAHNSEQVLRLFADDGKVQIIPPFPGAPGEFNGMKELTMFVGAFISGFSANGHDYRAEGNKVYFDATVAADAVKQAGLASVDQTDEIVVENGKIKAFIIRFTPETVAKLQTISQGL